MKFFLDENFPKSAVDVLVAFGHEVLDVRGTRSEGAEDSVLFALAQEVNAVLLSTDRDFFHTIPHSHPHHCGIVVIAVRQPNRQAILKRLEWFLAHFGDQVLAGRTFLLRDRTYATYPAPLETDP